MKVCITINDVIRRFYDTFKEVYEVYQEEESNFENNSEENNFEFGELDESGDIISQDSFNSKIEIKCLNLSGINDPMYLTKTFKFVDAEDFFNFLYNTMAFEIFAKTSTKYKNVIDDFHSLLAFFKSNNVTVDLVSVERGNSKPATLFFLSREKCKLDNLKFVSDYEKIWDEYQIVITSDNYLIENKRPRRKLFLIETDQNKHLNVGVKVKTLKDVLNILTNGNNISTNE